MILRRREILNLPMLQDALYPRGRMLTDASRQQKMLTAPDRSFDKS